MKRIDYFFPRAAVQITGVIFLVQVLTEFVGNRKPGFEWVLQICGGAFLASLIWTLFAVVLNAIRARGQE
jgi:hypothetical protein